MENPIAAQGRQRSAVELSCETTTPQGSTTWSPDRARRTNASRLRRRQCDSQPFIIEAWLGKDALTGISEDLLVHYRVTLNVGRGFDGWDSIHNAAQRLGDADFDPSGEAMVRSLREPRRDRLPLHGAARGCSPIGEAKLRSSSRAISQRPKWPVHRLTHTSR
jgi:hypothetical protein